MEGGAGHCKQCSGTVTFGLQKRWRLLTRSEGVSFGKVATQPPVVAKGKTREDVAQGQKAMSSQPLTLPTVIQVASFLLPRQITWWPDAGC